MSDDAAVAELTRLAEQVCHAGVLDQARVLQDGPEHKLLRLLYAVVIEGTHSIGDKTVSLLIGIPGVFPARPPKVYLKDPRAFGLLPHINASWELLGEVCTARFESLVVDSSRPMAIVQTCVEAAIELLAQDFRGENRQDIIDEFDAYWRLQEGLRELPSYVTPDDQPRLFHIVSRSNKKLDPIAITDSVDEMWSFSSRPIKPRRLRMKGLYIPLSEGSLVEPPLPGSPWGVDEYRRLVSENVVPENQRRARELAPSGKPYSLVVFSMHRPTPGKALFGAIFHGSTAAHPLLAGGDVSKIIPVALNRREIASVRPRGGANEVLASKRVAVVGCGSVGGYIASLLARSGVSSLVLVDHDTQEPENTFRHVLGGPPPGDPAKKVALLAEQLSGEIPGLSISSMDRKIEDLVANRTFPSSEFDLVILATGVHAVELWVADRFISDQQCPMLLHTWLEPLGIGGHVMLTFPASRRPGCLRCLFTDPDNDELVHNRADFADPEMPVHRNLTGCASSFTPYGAIDAVRTAALAVEVAIEGLLDSQAKPVLRSWRGSPDDLLQAGGGTTTRYELPQEDLMQPAEHLAHPRCPTCGSN